MGNSTASQTMRRSARLRVRIPVQVKSLDPAVEFSRLCEAVLVNLHGCALQSPLSLQTGTPLLLQIRDSGAGTGRVVDSQPMGSPPTSWIIGVELDKPANIWGIRACPEDWAHILEESARDSAGSPVAKAEVPGTPKLQLKMPVWPLASPVPGNGVSGNSAAELKKQLASQAEAIARLEQQLANVGDALQKTAQQQLSEFRERLLAEARERLAKLESEQGQQLQQLQAEIAAALAGIPDRVEQLSTPANQRLLGHARAELEKLEQQLACHLQAAPQTAQQQLSQIRAEVLAEAREQVRALHTHRAEQLQQLHSELTRAIATIPERVEQLTTPAVEGLVEHARSQVHQALASARQTPSLETGALREQIAAAVNEAVARASREISAHLAQEMESARARQRTAPQQAGSELRDRIYRDLDAKQKEVLQALQASLEQARLAQKNLEQLADGKAAQVAAQFSGIEKDLQARSEELLARMRGELSAGARSLAGEAMESARSDLRKLRDELWRALQEALVAEFNDRRQQLQEYQQTLTASTVQVEGITAQAEASAARLSSYAQEAENCKTHLDELTASLTAKADAIAARIDVYPQDVERECKIRLEHLLGDTVSRATEALQDTFKASVAVLAEQAQSELRKLLAPLLTEESERHQQLLAELNRMQRESAAWQKDLSRILQEKESLTTWIAGRTAEFQRMIHDLLIDTTGQIKGRIQMAVEMAQHPLEEMRSNASRALQQEGERQLEQLIRQAEEAGSRLTQLQHEVESSLGQTLRTQIGEQSGRFEQEIGEIARRSVEQWRAALATRLESVAEMLNQQLADSPEPDPDASKR